MSGVSILRTLCIVVHLKVMDFPNLNRQSFCINLLTQNSAQMMYTRFFCPPILVADPGRAQRVLGWTAERNLGDIVSSAWIWMQKNSKGEKAQLSML